MKKQILTIFIALLSFSAMADYKIIVSGKNSKIDLPEQTISELNHTFTNCGQEGRYGPTLSQCQTQYQNSDILSGNYNYRVNNGIQGFTVPKDGNYKITVYGAGAGINSRSTYSGKGAMISGEFTFESGDNIWILVGQKSSDNIIDGSAAGNTGGGGGSFVVKGQSPSDSVPLIIAGGGGGSETTYTDYPNMDGWQNRNGQSGGGSNSYLNAYGIEGNGSRYNGTNNAGGGGGGFYTDGTSSKAFDPSGNFNGGQGGKSFLNGGIGGESWYNEAHGGFGGGGGAYGSGGGAGGGGGYSGGANGKNSSNHTAGGGGSYNSGMNQTGQAGVNSGHGYVIISPVN